MEIAVQDEFVAGRLPAGDSVAERRVLRQQTAMMEFRHDEDAAAFDSVSRQKSDLLRDLRLRARMGIVQRDDEGFMGDGFRHGIILTSGLRRLSRNRFPIGRLLQVRLYLFNYIQRPTKKQKQNGLQKQHGDYHEQKGHIFAEKVDIYFRPN